MWKYILKRLLTTFLLLFAVVFIVYLIMEFTPGDPVMIKLGTKYTPETYEATRHNLGLDKPFFTRYLLFVKDALFNGSFGTSYNGRDVLKEVLSRAPRSMAIAFGAIIVATVFGVLFGIIAAINHTKWKDSATMIFALFGISMPDFWIGLLLSIVFSLKLGWLPVTGFYGPEYLILPVVTCSFNTMGIVARMTRSSMLEVIRQDYITTARAKGLSQRKIIFRHALKNALIPIITVVGTQASYLMGGVMVVETVFSVGGMGTLMMEGITALDYPMVLGCVIFVSSIACAIILITDIAYAFVDPRIRAQYQGKKRKKDSEEARLEA